MGDITTGARDGWSLRDVTTVGRRAVAEARDDHVARTAQALAYSLFLAIPSSLLVLLGVFRSLPIARTSRG